MLRAYKMNTEDFVFRCRKCRHYLFAPSNVVKTKDDEETRGKQSLLGRVFVWLLPFCLLRVPRGYGRESPP